MNHLTIEELQRGARVDEPGYLAELGRRVLDMEICEGGGRSSCEHAQELEAINERDATRVASEILAERGIKRYFISFNYRNSQGLDKFMFSITEIDLDSELLRDAALRLIKENDYDCFDLGLVIKITGFNSFVEHMRKHGMAL